MLCLAFHLSLTNSHRQFFISVRVYKCSVRCSFAVGRFFVGPGKAKIISRLTSCNNAPKSTPSFCRLVLNCVWYSDVWSVSPYLDLRERDRRHHRKSRETGTCTVAEGSVPSASRLTLSLICSVVSCFIFRPLSQTRHLTLVRRSLQWSFPVFSAYSLTTVA